MRRSWVALATVCALAVPGAVAHARLVDDGTPTCQRIAVAAGDFDGSLADVSATADLAKSLAPDVALIAGDIAYPDGSLAELKAQFGASGWPDVAPMIPVPGNHDYRTSEGADYYSYFNVPTYYARDIGCGWRVYALNSEEPLGEQVRWVTEDLAANPDAHVIALWHRPRWSSGKHGDNDRVQPLVDAFAGRAEMFIWGHDHNFERGYSDGSSWFVVGTGGQGDGELTALTATSRRFRSVPGVLRIELTDVSWTARFVAVR